MTRVFVVAASAIVRSGLEALVAGDARFEVVGTSSTVTAFLIRPGAEGQPPDVVLWEMGGQTNGKFTSLLAAEETDGEATNNSVVVALVDDPADASLAEALRTGALHGVLPSTATEPEIMAAVEAAAAGLVVVHPDMLDPLLLPPAFSPIDEQASPIGERAGEIEALTPREVEVLGMLAEGLGNKTIAWRLAISEHTVKFHVSSIFAKLGASSRTEAVTLGIRRGLIML